MYLGYSKFCLTKKLFEADKTVSKWNSTIGELVREVRVQRKMATLVQDDWMDIEDHGTRQGFFNL